MKLALIAFPCVAALLGLGCRSGLAPHVHVSPQTGQCTTREPVSQDRYLLYDRAGVDLQQALSHHAAQGYGLLFSSGNTLLFERPPDGAPVPEHVAVTLDAPLEHRLNDAGARGFRLLPDTFVLSHAIMRRDAGTTAAYEYRVASSNALPDMRTSIKALERLVSEVVADGYRIVDLARFGYNDNSVEQNILFDVFAIGERPLAGGSAIAASTEISNRLMLLAPHDRKLHQPLLQHASRGYRLVLVDEEPLLLLERAPDTHAPAEYVVVVPRGQSVTNAGRTLEGPMNAAAARGFRMRPDGVFQSRTQGFFWTPSVGVIMEKVADVSVVPEFRVLEAFRFATLQKELASALADRFTPIGMRTTNATYIVLQRPRIVCSETRSFLRP